MAMKKMTMMVTALLLSASLLWTPQQAHASSTQKFCAAHDAKLAQDMATAIAAVVGFKMLLGGTCSYIGLTLAVEVSLKSGKDHAKQFEKIVPRVIAASRGFFKVIVPTSDKAYEALKGHNEWLAKVFRGNMLGGFEDFASMQSASGKPQVKACRGLLKVFQHAHKVLLPAVAYLAASKGVCALAKAINPHCKKSSKHKNKCALPVYHDLPGAEVYSSEENQSCNAKRDKALDRFLKLASQYGPKLNAMGAFNKKLGALLGPTAKQLRAFHQTLSSFYGAVKPVDRGMKKLNSILKPLTKGLKALGALMNKQVCVPYKTVTTTRKCKKIKVAGKKTKKCTKVLKTTTKKVCTTIKNIGKAAGAVQKPLEKLADKAAKPILSRLPKKLPIPGMSKIKSKLNSLSSAMKFGKLASVMKTVTKAKTYVNTLSTLKSQLSSIKNNAR